MDNKTGATRRAFVGGIAASALAPAAALAQQPSAATGTPAIGDHQSATSMGMARATGHLP
jgi:hypothetical protein